MVTSNKLPDKKVVKMTEQNNSVVVPQRTLLGEVNEHITCPLCRGYYIDATTIVECLHSFCRSCIIKHLQVKSYCPVCEMMINSAKPNIKLDKALQDIVYKLVPGLFQKEMERRQQFYASRPGPAASATPEQRGEDTERIIFSPEDVISFSLEYADATDTDSISSKSSDSNEPQLVSATSRRYLQCPAVVNISHLKKFLSMKFDIDSTQFAIDILYKRVPLPDYYTLMDIAYIYNWKRNEPMRFFYQIIDYIAIRNRLFDINRKGSHFRDRKSSPASTEDTNVSSPAPNNDHGSEASSGTDSPMPGDNGSKQISDTSKKSEKSCVQQNKISISQDNILGLNKNCSSSTKNDDVEKSQFLNSFELTAKSNSTSMKSSPVKSSENILHVKDTLCDSQTTSCKVEDTLKRKLLPPTVHDMKKLKIEIEKTKLPLTSPSGLVTQPNNVERSVEPSEKLKESENYMKTPFLPSANNTTTSTSLASIEVKQQVAAPKQQIPEIPGTKRLVAGAQNISSPKRKSNDMSSMQPPSTTQKAVSPLKLQVPKLDAQSSSSKLVDGQKHVVKKIPDLKPSVPGAQTLQNKGQPVNKVRMDLLANNSDPTIDRSKILSQVKSSLGIQNTGQTSGDPLKSLFDSCKINIPSSLSITLTDQKQDSRNPGEVASVDPKKTAVNKNLSNASTVAAHKVPSPPVHNYIEILKLPDTDPKKLNKMDGNSEVKLSTPIKTESGTPQSKPPKSSETSTKGPIPNLKPIADTKLGKQGTNYASPITFQQTFEQQLQSSIQSEKKPKLKNKTQVPKLVPATPKAFSAANKLNSSNNKPTQGGIMSTIENKSSTALDLSTPHNIQSQLSPTKAFETMQSIANLAKKQNLSSKGSMQQLSQNFSSITNRPLHAGGPLRIPSTGNVPQIKLDKLNSSGLQTNNNVRPEMPSKPNQIKSTINASPSISSQNYQLSSLLSAQPPSRSQTRSPSSSPKLVIAEEKHNNPEQNINQSNQITSTQLSNANVPKTESPKVLPGPSKPGHKPLKPMTPSGKNPDVRQPMTSAMKPNPSPADIQLITAHQAILRHQMEMNAWLKAKRQFDAYKNQMSNISHQTQNDFNKDK